MKRTLQFKRNEKGYGVFEKEQLLFLIPIPGLQFDVKEFYEAFYSEGKDYENICIENCAKDDKTAKRTYDTIQNLISLIATKLNEANSATNEDKQEDSQAQESHEKAKDGKGFLSL